MPPRDVVHHVAEGAHHAIAAGGHLGGLLVHELIGVGAQLPGTAHLLLAEGVAVPAHHQAGLEGQGLVLPQAGHGMAVDAHAAVRVGLAAVGVELVLPEAAAKDRGLSVVHHAHADAAQLRVAAAGHHGGAFLQARVRGALGVDLADHLAAFGHGREDIILQAHLAHDGGVPLTLLQIEDAGGAAVAGFGLEHAGKLVDQPVVEHADGFHARVELRQLVLDPQDTRQRAQGIGLSGFAVDFLLQLRVHADELAHLVVAAGVDVGAGPDLPARLVVEHNALAHAGGADGRDVGRIHARLGNGPADARAGQLPVVHPVKVHTAGIARVLAVGPLVLHAAHLRAILVEKHRAHAARARVNGHQVSVCHDSFPSVSISLRLYRTGYAAPAWLPSSFSAVRSSVMSTSRYCPISAA